MSLRPRDGLRLIGWPFMSSDARSDALRTLSRFLVSELSVGDTLRRVAEIAITAMPAAEMAGISMLSMDGRPETGVYTDDASPEIDAGQYESGRGPCLDAWREKRPVRIDDMTAVDDRYPEFAALALDHDVHSTLSLPMVTGETGVGALNMYSRQCDGFSEDDESVGLELAAAASIVLSNVSAYWAAVELGEQLDQAMRTRAVIEQAKGVIMGSIGCSADAAFDVMRQQSQSENRKLHDIAREVVARQVRDAP